MNGVIRVLPHTCISNLGARFEMLGVPRCAFVAQTMHGHVLTASDTNLVSALVWMVGASEAKLPRLARSVGPWCLSFPGHIVRCDAPERLRRKASGDGWDSNARTRAEMLRAGEALGGKDETRERRLLFWDKTPVRGRRTAGASAERKSRPRSSVSRLDFALSSSSVPRPPTNTLSSPAQALLFI